MSSKLDGDGLSVDLPSGWDGRLVNRGSPVRKGFAATGPDSDKRDADDPRRNAPDGEAPTITEDAAGGLTRPIVHLANFALPSDRGDYGSGAVEVMNARHVLMVLTEFGPDSLGTALFAPAGLPRTVKPSEFSPNTLQRRLPHQLGYQHFFTEAGRPFSLFIVLGGSRHASDLCSNCSRILTGTRIEHR